MKMTRFWVSQLQLFFIVLLFYPNSVVASSSTISSLSSGSSADSIAGQSSSNSPAAITQHGNSASLTPVETVIDSTNSAAVTTSSLMAAAASSSSQVAGMTSQPAAAADTSVSSLSHVTIVTEQPSSVVGGSSETQSPMTSVAETLSPTAAAATAAAGSRLSANSSEAGGTLTSQLTTSLMLLSVPSSVVTASSLVAETTASFTQQFSGSTGQQNDRAAPSNSLQSTGALLTTTMSPVNMSTVDVLTSALSPGSVPTTGMSTSVMSTPVMSSVVASTSVMSTTAARSPLIIVGVPTGLTSTAFNTTTINVSWTAANNSEYYTVVVNGNHVCNTSSTSCVYGNLRPGCNYTVDVAACNNVNCSNNVSRTNNTFPATPTNLTCVSRTVSSLQVSWYQGGCTSSHFIRVNDTLLHQSVDNSSLFDITELTAGALYCMSVSAVSGQLNSSRSSETCCRTYPAAPTDLTLTARNESCVILRWNQTGIIDGYNVSISTGSPVNFTYQQAPVGSSYIASVCMLEAGALYVLQLSAFSGNLYSDVSSPLNISTVPAMPGEISVVNRTTDSIIIQWNQTGYASSFSVAGDIATSPSPSIEGSAPGTITASFQNLTLPGGKYTITVVAVSNDVESQPRNFTTHTVPASVSSVSCESVTNSSFSVYVNVSDIKLSYKFHVVSLIQRHPFDKTYEQAFFPFSVKDLAIAAGVTYSISVTSFVADVHSEPYVTECTTAVNVVKSPKVISVTERSLLVTWSRPDGFFQQFSVNCSSLTDDSSQVYDIDGSTNQYTCGGLTPGAVYNVSVGTIVNRTDVAPAVLPVVFAITHPLRVEGVTKSTVTNHSAELLVKYPSSSSRCTTFLVSTVPASHLFNVSCCTQVTLSDLQPNTNYTVHITAQSTYTFNVSKLLRSVRAVGSGSGTLMASSEVYTLPVLTLPSAVSDLTYSETKATSTVLSWSSTDDISLLTYYEVFVNKSGDNSCRQLVHISCNSPSKPTYAPGCGNPLPVDEFVTSCKRLSYTVTELEASTDYILTVFAGNMAGKGVGTGRPIQTNSADKGWIAGVVIGVVVGVLIIVAIGFFVWRRYRRRPRAMHKPSIGTDNPTFLGTGDMTDPPCAVLITEFVKHVDELHHDSDFRFSNEYELFKTLSPDLPKTVAELPANRTKNRYTNILPFDHSRVKLIPLDDDEEGSDYINASYMPGYFSKREYIAAQGPMKCTLDDFWRMIWEQNISVIVMLTNLTERGREKCEQYWPEGTEPVYYGDVQVEVKSESTLGHYVIRVLEVRSDVKKRVVKQIHFSSWPDFGCPKDVGLLLEFIQCVRSQMSSLSVPGPLLVHCSAGVGRTGTYIVIDRLLHAIQREDTIDLFGTILEMRGYRTNMIQTEAQYIFSHDCIRHAILRGMHLTNGPNGHANEESLYVNSGECLYMNTNQVNQVQAGGTGETTIKPSRSSEDINLLDLNE